MQYDVFISHAVEDKIAIANELDERLRKAGFRTWYSGNELGVGDSIENTINRGLSQSESGIIILSDRFFAKNWPQQELKALRNRNKKIFPILHEITLKEVEVHDPALIDLYAVSSSIGLEALTLLLAAQIGEITHRKNIRKTRRKFLVWGMVVAMVITGFILLANTWLENRQFDQILEASIHQRIHHFEEIMKGDQITRLHINEAEKGELIHPCPLAFDFMDTSSARHFRNEFTFLSGSRFNGINKMETSRTRTQAVLGIAIEPKDLCNSFNLEAFKAHTISDFRNSNTVDRQLLFDNPQPVLYEVTAKTSPNNGRRLVTIHYQQYIRSIFIRQSYVNHTTYRLTQTTIYALFPTEIYYFSKNGKQWTLEFIESQLGK